jgi:tartrate dehydrogenase/decarboxylase/D-malate dehydrogenase
MVALRVGVSFLKLETFFNPLFRRDKTMKTHRIAVIPGDGIGKEVVPEGLRCLDAAARTYNIGLAWDEFDWNCDYYLKYGAMMPADWKDLIGGHDAIFFGAVGYPEKVPDHVSLWGSLLKFRREFDQYVNLRPARLMPGVPSPLAGRLPGDIDFLIVRENTEGEYSNVGGRMFEGSERELVVQESIFTRTGVDRILRFAFELAARRPKKHLTSATKSNGISISMPFWDERFAAIGKEFPEVRADKFHIDILTANFVRCPNWFDVVVASNLFGDILSDLGPACVGTIAIAPSANLNPERKYPSLFEPVHGSAPDIAGRGIANPIGQIWAGSMMLDHLGYPDAAANMLHAIETVLAKGPRTPDMGGNASTADVGKAVAEAIAASG